jgi:hypothetical protein
MARLTRPVRVFEPSGDNRSVAYIQFLEDSYRTAGSFNWQKKTGEND